jgi:protein TonB
LSTLPANILQLWPKRKQPVAALQPLSSTSSGRDTITVAIALSLVVHAVLLLITFKGADFHFSARSVPHLDVVLVNSRGAKPIKADALAQANLDGGGNTEAELRAKTNLPVVPSLQISTELELASARLSQLELEAKRIFAMLGAGAEALLRSDRQNLPDPAATDDLDPHSRQLKIAQMEAQIAREWEAYQKLPRRKFIGTRTEGVVYAEYVDKWRQRIEKVGTEHFPDEARQKKIFGSLLLTVSIRANGTVEKVEIERSSGHRVLDAAALRVIELAGPFPPFPSAIRREFDILSITRNWSFTHADLELKTEL